MAKDEQPTTNINFMVDPNKTPVLYADGYLIGNNEHVVVLSFSQALPNASQQNVVARVAFTKAQAKDFLRALNDHIEKFEV